MEEIMLRKFIVASVAAMVIGGVTLAQNVTPPSATTAPAYLIAHVQVTDPEGWKQYLAALPSTLAPYHVKVLARAPGIAVDGSTPPQGSTAILAFNSTDDLKAWWNSPAYQAIIPLREKSAKTIVYAVPGLSPAP
jgi:uncharacterized protein (DUF1330 family)